MVTKLLSRMNMGSYLLSAIRIRPTEEDASKSFVELSVVAGETVYKSQLGYRYT